MPGAERGLRQVELLTAIDVRQPSEWLMVLPASNDGVGEHRGASEASLDWKLKGGRSEYVRCRAALLVLANELLVRDGYDHARSRATLQHLARFAANQLEGVQALAQNLRWQDLERDSRECVWQGLSHGFSPLMSRNRLLGLGLGLLGTRPQAITTEREIENCERELRIILGEPLRLLTKQTELEALDLLLQNQRELLVLVALTLELGAMLVVLTLLLVESCVEPRFECC